MLIGKTWNASATAFGLLVVAGTCFASSLASAQTCTVSYTCPTATSTNARCYLKLYYVSRDGVVRIGEKVLTPGEPFVRAGAYPNSKFVACVSTKGMPPYGCWLLDDLPRESACR